MFNADGTPKQKEIKTTEEIEEDEMIDEEIEKMVPDGIGGMRGTGIMIKTNKKVPTGKKIKVIKENTTYEDEYEDIKRKDKNK